VPAPFRLSILDQSPISQGSTGAQALRNTLDLATLADQLGYHRYWVAEHHGGTMLAGPSPEALIGPIAAATRRIRVGSGGVMLPHYSPLKVAETFSVLAGLFPGSIDLGLGRLAKTLPGAPERPAPWLLGSSPQSAVWAAELGLPYAFADFINQDGAEIAALYRERFAEHEHAAARARTAVAAWVVCADSDDEARRLAASARMTFTLLRRGELIAVPPPEEALEFLAADDRTGAPRPQRRAILGAPGTVRTELEALVESYSAEEAIIVTITYDHQARRRSYELLAQAFE
jgi:alkanesulfonate monooxygenase SsuD/methylene tetrahydromethanopterin reductase-like flavin-dependent oxidoreductase (luciferase family)